MALTRSQKEESVKELTTKISEATNIIVWEYHGTTAEEISGIRKNIREKSGFNKVYKNRLAKLAFKESGKEEIIDILTGPNSFLFTFDNDEGSMKELAKAIKENESLKFKGGYIEGEWHDAESVAEIANLPGKEELLSMLLSVLQAPMRNLAYSLSQVAQQLPADDTKEEAAPAEEAKTEEAQLAEQATEESKEAEATVEETKNEEATTEEAKDA